MSTPNPLGNLLTLVPCICTGRGGHTDPLCPWWFAVDAVKLASHDARAAKRAADYPGDEEVQRRAAAAARLVRAAAARGATQ